MEKGIIYDPSGSQVFIKEEAEGSDIPCESDSGIIYDPSGSQVFIKEEAEGSDIPRESVPDSMENKKISLIEEEDEKPFLGFEEETDNDVGEGVSGDDLTRGTSYGIDIIEFPEIKQEFEAENDKLLSVVVHDHTYCRPLSEMDVEIDHISGHSPAEEVLHQDLKKETEFSNKLITCLLESKKFLCHYCQLYPYSKCSLGRHIGSGHKSYESSHCTSNHFNTSELMKQTWRRHINGCDVCMKRFLNGFSLMTAHTREKPLVCEECDQVFRKSSHLLVQKGINIGDKYYVCDMCGESFIECIHLKAHKEIHIGEKPYVCEECGIRFRKCGNYKRHMRIHNGEKPYVCEECNKAFSQNYNLKKHKKIHNNEKPYICEACGICFTRITSLVSHKKIHSEKSYICISCGKVFKQSRALMKHMTSHTREKEPFVCQECGNVCTSICELKKHKRIHTGENLYECQECDNVFTRRSNLVRHKRSIHS